jgi:CcmD family protein
MGYLLTAYGVVLVTLAGYTIWLSRRRQSLREALDSLAK